jgi:hypothetical protein
VPTCRILRAAAALSPIALASSFVRPLANLGQAFPELDAVRFVSLDKLDSISVHGWASTVKTASLFAEVSPGLDFILTHLDSQFSLCHKIG